MTQSPFACPLDGLPLVPVNKSLRCANNHTFDVSRYGYVNLLPVQLKPSRDPGDSKAMVAARRRVLDAGVFQPLAIAINEIATGVLTPSTTENITLLDAGCGEGYYTASLHEALCDEQEQLAIKVAGVDISRWAVTAATKRYPHLSWAVGNNKQLPLATGAAQLITCIFGFPTWQPWSILQHAGQSVMVVDAGLEHLLELRELIYPEVKLHKPDRTEASTTAGYLQTTTRQVRFQQLIERRDQLDDLLLMTPHGAKATTDRRASIDQLVNRMLTIDTTITVYQKS